jgi:DNA-binding IclR family transcriptional regulator
VTPDKPAADKVSYQARVFTVLEAALELSDSSRPASELTERLGLPLSTTSRLVNFLVAQGMLSLRSTGGYGPGPRMFRLAMRTLDQLHESDQLDRVTRELSKHTGESVSIGLIVSDKIVLVSRCEPDASLRAVARVGDLIQPHTSAMGKAILAACTDDHQRRMVEAAEGEVPASVLDELSGELAEVRRVGYAVDEETYSPGLRCRAAVILGPGGRPAGGISIAGPAARYSRELADAGVDELKAQAAALSSIVEAH